MVRHDAIVIGAGLNGLTAAAHLARAGLKVLVLDRNGRAGGTAAMRAVEPGFFLPAWSLRGALIDPATYAGLGLAEAGLRVRAVDAGVSWFGPGEWTASFSAGTAQRAEFARHAHEDGDAWRRYRRDMLRLADVVTPALTTAFPQPGEAGLSAFGRRLGFASELAAWPRTDMAAKLDIWTESISTILDRYFTSPLVKAHLAGAALAGATVGPSSPMSAWRLLVPFLQGGADATEGSPRLLLPVGGTDALVTCLAGIVEAAGGELRMEAEVTDVKLRDRQVRGVVLADGEEIAAPVIISDLDFKRTILGLFQWKDIPGDLVEAAGRFRMKGTTAKLNLALDRQPRIEGVPRDCPALAGGLRLMGSLAEQDKAHACWHMNVVPQNPELSVFLPSLVDPALAPPGKHVMSVLVNWVPETPHDGPWTEEKKNRLTEAVLEKLETAMPGLRETVRAQEMWLPHEVENETGITSGDLDQGEMTLDQMFFNRPTPFGAPGGGYATPLKNFYLCSQSTHPGSLLPARAGANTAAAILASMKRRQGA